jgi:hypothetical protein
MKKREVKLSFSHMANGKFLERGREIQTGLANPVFNTVQPSPSEVSPYLDNFQALLTETNSGNRTLVPERDALRKQITEMFYKQGLCVNMIAASDLAILRLSNFEISKEPQKHSVPPAPKTLNVAHIGPAAAELKSERIENADILEYEVDGPDGFCKRYLRKTSKLKLTDLPVGVILKATVRGINSYGEGPWSETVTFTVYGPTQHNNTAA